MNINTKTIKASIQSIGNSLVVYGFITSLFIKVKKKYVPFIVLAIIYNINPNININNVEIKNYFTSPPTSPVPHIANYGRFTLKALTSFVETDLDANYFNDLVVVPLKLQHSTLKALTR